MKLSSIGCYAVLILSYWASVAQEPAVNCSDSIFCVPGVVGLPRTKGIHLKYERILDYGIHSYSKDESIRNDHNEVQLNRRIEFKARVPLVVKPQLSMALGFKYFNENYQFENTESSYPFYQSLNNKPLKSIGGTLYVVKPFRGNTYALLRVSGDLNGDYNLDDIAKARFLRISVSPLIGFKRNDYLSYAFGVSYNYIFGRPLISPVVAYNQTFNRRWGVELLLPSSAKLRYSPNPKNYWYAIAELNGANYTIRLPDSTLARRNSLYLQKSEVRFLLNYEREIYDFLWFGVEAGMRTNINFSLSESVHQRRHPIIRNQLNNALLLNFSLFVVPPRRFVKG